MPTFHEIPAAQIIKYVVSRETRRELLPGSYAIEFSVAEDGTMGEVENTRSLKGVIRAAP
jgi:hypothetical protein